MSCRLSVHTMVCVLILASLTMAGCLGSREWTYPPPPDKTYLDVSAAQPISASLAVLPLEDKRGTAVQEEYWKIAIPLVHYGVTVYDRPETISKPEPIDEVIFDPPRDFARVVADEIQKANIFSSVTFVADDQQAPSSDFVLRGSLYSTRWSRTISTYLLGPLGPVLWLVGLPMGNTTTEVAMDMRLTPADDPSRVLWHFSMEFENQEVDTLYHGLEESVKNYPQSIQEALGLVILDLADKMPPRTKGF